MKATPWNLRYLSLSIIVLFSMLIAACAPAVAVQPAAPIGQGQAAVAEAMPLEVSVEQAKELYDSGVFLLDVRQPEEWEAGHVPNASLIPLGELPNRINELPKDQPIVIICRSGNRSATGRDILLQAGFGSVTSVAGGMNVWSAAGYPTVTGP